MLLMGSLYRIPRAFQAIWIALLYVALIVFWLTRGTAYEWTPLGTRVALLALLIAAAPVFLINARQPRIASSAHSFG